MDETDTHFTSTTNEKSDVVVFFSIFAPSCPVVPGVQMLTSPNTAIGDALIQGCGLALRPDPRSWLALASLVIEGLTDIRGQAIG